MLTHFHFLANYAVWVGTGWHIFIHILLQLLQPNSPCGFGAGKLVIASNAHHRGSRGPGGQAPLLLSRGDLMPQRSGVLLVLQVLAVEVFEGWQVLSKPWVERTSPTTDGWCHPGYMGTLMDSWWFNQWWYCDHSRSSSKPPVVQETAGHIDITTDGCWTPWFLMESFMIWPSLSTTSICYQLHGMATPASWLPSLAPCFPSASQELVLANWGRERQLTCHQSWSWRLLNHH